MQTTIVRGKRCISPETVWLFAEALGTTPEFWLNLQTNYDLVRFRPKRQVERITATAWWVPWILRALEGR